MKRLKAMIKKYIIRKDNIEIELGKRAAEGLRKGLDNKQNNKRQIKGR